MEGATYSTMHLTVPRYWRVTLASSSLVAGMRQPLPTKPSAINQGNEGLVWLPFFDRSRTASLEAGVARAKRAGGAGGSGYLGGVCGRRPSSALALAVGFSTWKEHMRFSSTYIIAPLLSNSPQ